MFVWMVTMTLTLRLLYDWMMVLFGLGFVVVLASTNGCAQPSPQPVYWGDPPEWSEPVTEAQKREAMEPWN